MANVYAVKSGNWSDTTVWNTGALPTSADDVYANNFTVTIDISPTVLSVRNSSATGITQGGTFSPNNGITLTCTGSGIVSGGTGICLTSTITTSQSATLIGNCTAGTSIAVRHSGLGTLYITGNVIANDSGATAYYGVQNSSAGTIYITGNTTGYGNANHGTINSSNGTIYITGNCTAASSNNGASGAYNASTGIINITGNCNGGSGTANYGATNASTGSMIVTGTANGSSNVGLYNSGSGTITHYGSCIANANSAVSCTNSGIYYATGPFIGTSSGISAISAGRWRWIPSVGSSYMTVPNSTATGYKNLYTADSTLSNSGQPAITNVRSGTVYGPNSELTGTCAVPAAGSVALGVAVDNTTGTAILTQTNVLDALTAASAVTLNQQTSSLTTSGSIGERLKLVSTVATTAQQLSDALSNE